MYPVLSFGMHKKLEYGGEIDSKKLSTEIEMMNICFFTETDFKK